MDHKLVRPEFGAGRAGVDTWAGMEKVALQADCSGAAGCPQQDAENGSNPLKPPLPTQSECQQRFGNSRAAFQKSIDN